MFEYNQLLISIFNKSIRYSNNIDSYDFFEFIRDFVIQRFDLDLDLATNDCTFKQF